MINVGLLKLHMSAGRTTTAMRNTSIHTNIPVYGLCNRVRQIPVYVVLCAFLLCLWVALWASLILATD